MRRSIEVSLGGSPCLVEGDWEPADPSVGLGPTFDVDQVYALTTVPCDLGGTRIVRVQITALLEDWMPEAFWIRLADIVLDNLAQQGQPNDPDDD